MLQYAISKSRSVCLFAIHHNHDPGDLKCWNTLHIIYSDVSSFFNFLDVKFRSPQFKGSSP